MPLMIPELKTIRLYGVLGARFGREHKFSIGSPQEAIKALCTMLPGFQQFMIESNERGLTFSVFEGKVNLNKETILLPSNGEDIRIAPIIIGSKSAGVFQTILGAVLVAAGFVLSFTPLAPASPFLYMSGASMMLGGVVQMLSPMDGGLSARESPDNKPSYAFGGPVNSIAQGNPVPILYGKRRIGGAIISAGIYAEDQQ